MKKTILIMFIAALCCRAMAQNLKAKDVPAIIKEALSKKYPKAAQVSWEKEKGNYEANWGGKSGEDTSVQFTPAGAVVNQLPAAVAPYIKAHYNGAKIKEAGKVTDAASRRLFEVEIKGKDLIFDKNGKFVKKD
jgi:hypothetical protein